MLLSDNIFIQQKFSTGYAFNLSKKIEFLCKLKNMNVPKNNVRIVDIAEKLKVSTATVSNVIHGKTKKISDETVQLVQKALEEENYIPSVAKILMAQNNSKIIGIVINNNPKYEGNILSDPFIAESLNALSFEIEKRGFFMMVKLLEEEKINDLEKFASMWNLEGFIIIGFCNQNYKMLRNKIRIPFVIYDGFINKEKENLLRTPKFCNISIDNFSGGLQVGEHFRKTGHIKVLFIADNCVCMDKERFEGFKEGFLQQEETAENSVDFLQIPMNREDRILFYEKNLQKIQQNTAIFCASDFYAVDIMNFLKEKGFSIPDDFCIVGFDDSPLCRQTSPNLSSVSQCPKTRALLALDLLEELKDKESESFSSSKMLDVKLVVRKSSTL